MSGVEVQVERKYATLLEGVAVRGRVRHRNGHAHARVPDTKLFRLARLLPDKTFVEVDGSRRQVNNNRLTRI